MIRRSGERGSGISVLEARRDDDDDDIYIYIYIYIYMYHQITLLAQISLTLFLSIRPYYLSLLAGLLNYILCPHKAVVGNFFLVNQHWHVYLLRENVTCHTHTHTYIYIYI